MGSLDWLQTVTLALLARAAWVVLGLFVSTVFGVYIRDREKFAGKWHMDIHWTPEHAQRLFGKIVQEPHSRGDVVITYGFGPDGKGYWGLAYFELFSGVQLHARLCVELEDMQVGRRWFSKRFPYLLRAELKELRLRSRIRETTIEFDYGPWAQYRMEFSASSGQTLTGHMVLVESNTEVGVIEARRTQ